LFIASFSLFKGEKNTISIKVKENEVIIDNFEMAKVVDEKNNFYKINAVKAVMNRNLRTAELTDFTLVYKKGETDLTAKSHQGILQEEKRIDVNGSIEGTVNDMTFETGQNGSFYYDFATETGVMSGNILVNSPEGTILAETATIYQRINSVEFDGNVKVIYKN